jgi:hypothetical protein
LIDQALKVVYRRGEDGQLYVWLYRGKLHLGTVQVDNFNCLTVFRGVANSSPVFVKYLPKEGNVDGGCLPLSRQDLSQ